MKLHDKINDNNLNANDLCGVLEKISTVSVTSEGSRQVTIQNYEGYVLLDEIAEKALNISKNKDFQADQNQNLQTCNILLKKWYTSSDEYSSTICTRVFDDEITKNLKLIFMKNINEWVLNGGVKDNQNNRETAALKMEQVYDNKQNTLDLSRLKLTSIPTGIGFLTNLSEINLFNNNLITVPREIGLLVKLDKLSLNNNNITSIPNEIGNLTNLKNFRLDYNSLTVLLPEIGKLISLQELCIQSNKLKELPSEIGKLKNLNNLWIHSNPLTSIPLSLAACENLKKIANDLFGLVKTAPFYDQIAKILTQCKAKNFMEWIIKETEESNMDTLDLTCVDPTKLSKGIETQVFNSEKLQQNLQALYLPKPMIENLPVSIRQLKNLKTLSIK